MPPPGLTGCYYLGCGTCVIVLEPLEREQQEMGRRQREASPSNYRCIRCGCRRQPVCREGLPLRAGQPGGDVGRRGGGEVGKRGKEAW